MDSPSIKQNALLNILRTLLSIVFPLITFPYATRVLGTANYGKVSFGSSIISYIALVAGLGVVEYAVREGAKVREDKKSFQNLVDQILSINIISTFISYVLLLILILTWKKLDGYAVLLFVQSISVLFTTLGTDWINTAYEDYFYITVRYIVCHLISIVLMFVIVKSSDDYIQYAFTTIATNLFANISNIYYVRKKYNIYPKFTLKIDAKKHMKPIMILFGSTIASLVYINSDVLMLGTMKDEKTVGIYSAGAKVYTVVKAILNASLAVTIPRVSSNIANSIDNQKLLEQIRKVCILFLLPASAGLFFVGDKIILLLSGIEYAAAGGVLKVLAVALFFATSGCYYISVIMIPYGKEKWVLIGTSISACVNIILNFFLIPRYGSLAAAYTTVISEIIMMVVGIISTRNIIRMQLVKPYYVSAISIGTLYVLSKLGEFIATTNAMQLIITIITGVVCVGIIICIFYFKDVSMLVKSYKNKR